jgi:hypothetical protein
LTDIPRSGIAWAKHDSCAIVSLARFHPAFSRFTRDLLGWQPARPGLIADLKAGHYFA